MSALSERLRTGIHPGLPAPMTRVPFGRLSSSSEELGLMPAQLKLVVALVAAEFTQMGPVSALELGEVTGSHSLTHLSKLERAGWVAVAGRLPRSTSKVYVATLKAKRALGLEDWSLLGEIA